MGRLITVRAPNTIEEITYGMEPRNVKVFLAGCADNEWRKDFTKHFDKYPVTFLDPKRDDWDTMTKADLVNQVKWEYDYLRDADIICYAFNSKESMCPITLLEYGMWGLATGRPIIVYVDDDYKKREDVVLQTILARPEIQIINRFDGFVGRTQLTIMDYGRQRSS